MIEWTPERLMEQGYFLDDGDGDHPTPNAADVQHHKNAAHRESMLPCSGSAGQPLTPKEPVTPRTEVQRLEVDPERTRRMLAARKELGL
jgi:hypothetical protein